MPAGDPRAASRWYRSFYWRIGVGFVVCVVGVIVAQGLIVSYAVVHGRMGAAPSPNELAARAAAQIAVVLTRDPDLDLADHLRTEYGGLPFPLAVVMKDGRVAGNGPQGLPEPTRRLVDAVLAGASPLPGSLPVSPAPLGMIAPIEAGGRLVGVVVLPPPVGPRRPAGLLADFGRVLWAPGTGLLIVGSAVAAWLIFKPARRRLRALEEATERIGAGDLGARAPERGGDEIARVAWAFNRMARDLAARDEAVRTSDRLRRQMFADVSHELKTPLTVMRGYLETLRMRDLPLDEETRERYLGTVERETLRLDALVRDLLDLARYENFATRLDVRPFATERLFAQVLQRHEHEAASRGTAMVARVEDGAEELVADPARLDQALENLVANAMRHTSAGDRIELAAEVEGTRVRLSVVDTGEGIPPEHLPHVFDRFYKVDASRTPGARGSGLGLSIVKAIAEQHGGRVTLASRPGETRFTIVLPRDASA